VVTMNPLSRALFPPPPSPTNGGVQVRADGAFHHEPLNDENHEGSMQGFRLLTRLLLRRARPNAPQTWRFIMNPFTTATMNPLCRDFVHYPIHPDPEGPACLFGD
jgi:hypothetical protein